MPETIYEKGVNDLLIIGCFTEYQWIFFFIRSATLCFFFFFFFFPSRCHHHYLSIRRNKSLVYSIFGTDLNGISTLRVAHLPNLTAVCDEERFPRIQIIRLLLLLLLFFFFFFRSFFITNPSPFRSKIFDT